VLGTQWVYHRSAKGCERIPCAAASAHRDPLQLAWAPAYRYFLPFLVDSLTVVLG